MKKEELIDSLIELSCENMPDEARQSIDNTIDHLISSMDEDELQGLLVNGMKHFIDDDTPHKYESEMESLDPDDDCDRLLLKSRLTQNIAFA